MIAVVSHADVIKAIAASYAGMPFDLFQRLVIDTASVTWFRFTPHGPRLLKFNDTGSLEPPKPEPPESQAADEQQEGNIRNHPHGIIRF